MKKLEKWAEELIAEMRASDEAEQTRWYLQNERAITKHAFRRGFEKCREEALQQAWEHSDDRYSAGGQVVWADDIKGLGNEEES